MVSISIKSRWVVWVHLIDSPYRKCSKFSSQESKIRLIQVRHQLPGKLKRHILSLRPRTFRKAVLQSSCHKLSQTRTKERQGNLFRLQMTSNHAVPLVNVSASLLRDSGSQLSSESNPQIRGSRRSLLHQATHRAPWKIKRLLLFKMSEILLISNYNKTKTYCRLFTNYTLIYLIAK